MTPHAAGRGRGFVPAPEPDDRSTHGHRQLIGWLGLALPELLWIIAAWRPMAGLPRWAPLTSISAYYHTGAVAAFVGVLIALAVFLFTYRGYANAWGRRDRIAAIVAGSAAVLVAFFPTEPPRVVPAPPWWAPWMGRLHYASAVVLFGAFIYFALFLFPKSKAGAGKRLPRDKRGRNVVYRSCGVAMVGCVAWAGWASPHGAPIVWPEALALWCFAASWLAKGRVDRTASALGRRTLEYPRRMVARVRGAMRR